MGIPRRPAGCHGITRQCPTACRGTSLEPRGIPLDHAEMRDEMPCVISCSREIPRSPTYSHGFQAGIARESVDFPLYEYPREVPWDTSRQIPWHAVECHGIPRIQRYISRGPAGDPSVFPVVLYGNYLRSSQGTPRDSTIRILTLFRCMCHPTTCSTGFKVDHPCNHSQK